MLFWSYMWCVLFGFRECGRQQERGRGEGGLRARLAGPPWAALPPSPSRAGSPGPKIPSGGFHNTPLPPLYLNNAAARSTPSPPQTLASRCGVTRSPLGSGISSPDHSRHIATYRPTRLPDPDPDPDRPAPRTTCFRRVRFNLHFGRGHTSARGILFRKPSCRIFHSRNITSFVYSIGDYSTSRQKIRFAIICIYLIAFRPFKHRVGTPGPPHPRAASNPTAIKFSSVTKFFANRKKPRLAILLTFRSRSRMYRSNRYKSFRNHNSNRRKKRIRRPQTKFRIKINRFKSEYLFKYVSMQLRGASKAIFDIIHEYGYRVLGKTYIKGNTPVHRYPIYECCAAGYITQQRQCNMSRYPSILSPIILSNLTHVCPHNSKYTPARYLSAFLSKQNLQSAPVQRKRPFNKSALETPVSTDYTLLRSWSSCPAPPLPHTSATVCPGNSSQPRNSSREEGQPSPEIFRKEYKSGKSWFYIYSGTLRKYSLLTAYWIYDCIRLARVHAVWTRRISLQMTWKVKA